MLRIQAMAGVLAVVAGTLLVATPRPADAQAQCREKCVAEEQACLKRTGNKGQCGGKAGQCLAKCK